MSKNQLSPRIPGEHIPKTIPTPNALIQQMIGPFAKVRPSPCSPEGNGCPLGEIHLGVRRQACGSPAGKRQFRFFRKLDFHRTKLPHREDHWGPNPREPQCERETPRAHAARARSRSRHLTCLRVSCDTSGDHLALPQIGCHRRTLPSCPVLALDRSSLSRSRPSHFQNRAANGSGGAIEKRCG